MEPATDKKMKETEGLVKGGGENAGNERVPFFKLFSFADGLDMLLMLVGTIGAIGNGLAMPIMTVIFGQLINSFGSSTKNNVLEGVSKVALKFVYLALGVGVAAFLQVACWMVTGERQAARIRGLYLKNILRQDMAFFDKETKTGEVIGRMSGDTILIQDAMGEKVGKFIQLVSTFFGGFAVAFIKGWRLALVMLSCVPPMVLAGAVMSIFISKATIRGQKAYAEAGNIVDQTVGSIRTVMSFTGEKKAIEEYNKSLKAAYKCAAQQGLIGGIGLGTVVLVMFSSYALAVYYGSRMIIEDGYTGGEVVNVMMAVMTGGMALGQVSPSLSAFAMGSAAAYKMFEVIKQTPLIDVYDTKGAVLEDIKGDIELRNVHFSYPARPDVQIFSGFSLHIPSGTTVALVGESGSGKSTVISLVERFYDPQAGDVLIDGINLKDLRLSWMREKIGLVSQEPILFMTSIKENIVYGKPGATDEEIKKAIKLANAAKFIDKLPKGMDTMAGEQGTQLSGGQKQRIAIARAILKNPKILLLDEATSALDAESERIVQEALTRIMVDRTTVVVAHRLTTVRNADNIAVVQQGKIVEKGSHLELIKNPDGAYSQLVRLQVDNQNEKMPAMDPDEINSSFEISKAPSRSASRNDSLIRSISRASSSGLSIAFSLVRAISTREDGPVGLDGGKDDDDDDDGTEEARHKASTVRLASLNRPELPALFFGMIAAAIHGVTFPLFGLLLSSAIKIFFEPHPELRKDCKFWSLMFVTLGAIILCAVPIQLYLFGVAGGKLIQRIRSLTFMKVVHQEISWFDDPNNSSGAISARLSMDASSVRSLVGDTLALVVQNLATIIAALVLAMLANWELALIILVLLPLVGLQGYAQMKFIQGFSADAKVMYEEASQVASDGVRGIRTIASFSAEQKVMALYEQKCEVPLKHGVRQGLVSGVGFGFSFLVVFSTNALIFYAGARLVEDGKTTFSQVFKVFFSLVMAALGISQSSAMAPNTTKAKDAAASIFAILDRKSKIDSSSDEGVTLPSINGDIDFKNVSFRYPTRPDARIFRDLCLRIHSGKTVALVGESGSGKSTVIALLERFYDPDSGKILLDGMEIQRFNLRWLRQQMGLVSQEPVLFNDTIRANLTYGTEGDISEEEIIAVATAANVHHLISGLPQGYDTFVGERGTQLSGGQKQRIAIARAILKNPKILLLDEATSALDVESEHIVQEALDKVMVNRTTIVVAHRLSTIKGADVIAVVKNGVIAEQGSHDKLVTIKDGAYASLVALRMSSSP